jgi:hypothetical protein
MTVWISSFIFSVVVQNTKLNYSLFKNDFKLNIFPLRFFVMTVVEKRKPEVSCISCVTNHVTVDTNDVTHPNG